LGFGGLLDTVTHIYIPVIYVYWALISCPNKIAMCIYFLCYFSDCVLELRLLREDITEDDGDKEYTPTLSDGKLGAENGYI
jgi:hypothetical protein